MPLHHVGALGLELTEPVHRTLEAVDACERVKIAIGDDPEAVAA